MNEIRSQTENKKFLIKWNFKTLWGIEKRQKTLFANSEEEAIQKISPFNPVFDRITSVEEI